MAATAHFLTPSIVRLDLRSRGQSLGPATGFFLPSNDAWALVTNWHVLSGRDPRTGQPLSNTGAVPDECHYSVLTKEGVEFVWKSYDVSLGDALLGTANWLQHPTKGQLVDIGIIPMPAGSQGQSKDLLDPTGHDPQMWIDLGADVFLPGFPRGLASNNGFPIWKRGSLATSPEFGERRTFLVDTATREGMSGAPCLALANWQYYQKEADTERMNVVNRPLSWKLLGVYSGRVNSSDEFAAQLGVIWSIDLLLEMLNSGVAASIKIVGD